VSFSRAGKPNAPFEFRRCVTRKGHGKSNIRTTGLLDLADQQDDAAIPDAAASQ